MTRSRALRVVVFLAIWATLPPTRTAAQVAVVEAAAARMVLTLLVIPAGYTMWRRHQVRYVMRYDRAVIRA